LSWEKVYIPQTSAAQTDRRERASSHRPIGVPVAHRTHAFDALREADRGVFAVKL
jgi:hypothetical protein